MVSKRRKQEVAHYLNTALQKSWEEWGEDTTEDQIAIAWLAKYNDDGTTKRNKVKRRKRGK
jgi:hypothetical protein